MSLHLHQRGDTIVEVLIAIAIVSLVLAGAYVSTNHNTQSIQDAQERGQALKLVESQIELLKVTAGTPAAIITTSPPATHDCFDVASRTPKDDNGSHATGTNDCEFGSNGQKATAGIQPAYRLSIVSDGLIPATYTVKAAWDSLLGSSQDQVVMYYRPN